MAIKAIAQQTIIDITDAYSVYLTCPSYTFPGSQTGAKAGSAQTDVMAMRGNESVSVKKNGNPTAPTGVTATAVDNSDGTVTVTVAVTTSVTQPGKVTIPVLVNDEAEFTLEFAYGIALTGPSGTSVTVASTSVTYQVSSSGTSVPTGTWSDSVPSNYNNGTYLWTKNYVKYSDGTETTSYSVSYKGTNGSNGSSVTVTQNTVTYQVASQGTTAPTSGTWSSSIPSGYVAGTFLWIKTYTKYSDGTETTAYSVAYKGTDGNDGADALTMVITSSGGTIFKNSSISTTLTAHVYKGGAELSAAQIAAEGTIKWYKDGSTTAAGTGTTMNITASDVNQKLNIIAQLEG